MYCRNYLLMNTHAQLQQPLRFIIMVFYNLLCKFTLILRVFDVVCPGLGSSFVNSLLKVKSTTRADETFPTDITADLVRSTCIRIDIYNILLNTKTQYAGSNSSTASYLYAVVPGIRMITGWISYPHHFRKLPIRPEFWLMVSFLSFTTKCLIDSRPSFG